MPGNLQLMNEEVAAGLILQAIAKKQGVAATSKSTFGGSKQRYDIIVERIIVLRLGDEYAAFTFYAVPTGKAKSTTRAVGELVLKDVVSKLLDHAMGQVSSIYSLSGDLSGAVDGVSGGWMNTEEIYSNAEKIGGQMQLHAAKKMGKRTYDQVRIFGLSAHVVYGGVARFSEVKNISGGKGLNIIMSYWNGLTGSVRWIDRFKGATQHDASSDIKNLHKWGGDHHVDYIYSPGNGKMW